MAIKHELSVTNRLEAEPSALVEGEVKMRMPLKDLSKRLAQLEMSAHAEMPPERRANPTVDVTFLPAFDENAAYLTFSVVIMREGKL